MRLNTGPQQLISAQTQRVAQALIDLIDGTACGGRDHRVEKTTGPACSIGELGGEGGVAAGDTAFAQQRGQRQIGVSILARYRPQYVEGGLTRWVKLTPRTLRRTRTPPGVLIRPAARRTRTHSARTSASSRAPRAQSAAFITFLP